MLLRVVLIAAVLLGGYYLLRGLRRTGGLSYLGRVLPLAALAVLLVLLTVRGGAEIAAPLLAVLAPFLLRAWRAGQLTPPAPAASAAGSIAQSTVVTRFLRMSLDHASGAMSGTVHAGHFAGRDLATLSPAECLLLWRECQTDPQSLAVLEAYLDRHGAADWRTQATADTGAPPADQVAMDRTEAYQILGLAPGASRTEIQAAYRRLMQRLHPDQGGSAYLAAQLNQARATLLRDSP